MKVFQFTKTLALVSLFSLMMVVGAANAAPAPDKAKAYVEDLGTKAVGIVTDSRLSEDAKRTSIMELMRGSIDFEWVGRFVMGRYWKVATDEQKKRYIELYREFLLKSYTTRVKEYTSVSFKVTDTEKQGDKEFTVHTEIARLNDSPIKVDYRLIEDSGSKFRIIDMVVEGVSLLTTQRSEFNSILSRDGVDKLNDMLEKRSKEL